MRRKCRPGQRSGAKKEDQKTLLLFACPVVCQKLRGESKSTELCSSMAPGPKSF